MGSKQTMRAPMVHLNGTSRDALLSQQKDVLDALLAVDVALRESAPNMRDYYLQEGGSFADAIKEHISRIAAVSRVSSEVYAIMEAICDGKTEATVDDAVT